MALKSYDWKGNLLHDFGGQQYQYLDYIGGGYFVAQWAGGGGINYGILKIVNGSVYMTKLLSSGLVLMGNTLGGVVHDGHHFWVARESYASRPQPTWRRYIEKRDWNWKRIINKEIDSTVFSVAPKAHCIELDGSRLIYGMNGYQVNSIGINNLVLGQLVYALGVAGTFFTLLDMCMTKHRIITTNLDSGANQKRVYIWDKTKTATKVQSYFDIAWFSGVSTGVTTDGRVIYVGM